MKWKTITTNCPMGDGKFVTGTWSKDNTECYYQTGVFRYNYVMIIRDEKVA